MHRQAFYSLGRRGALVALFLGFAASSALGDGRIADGGDLGWRGRAGAHGADHDRRRSR